MRTIEGHTRKVTAVAVFNDSRRVVTGSSDSTLRIWDAETGASVGGPFEPEGLSRGGTFRSLAVSPDDRLIASGGSHGIILWDIERMQVSYDFKPVNSVCFSPDGKRLAGGGESDDQAFIWDTRTCDILENHEQKHIRNNSPAPGVLSVAFSPDGLKLACASSGGYINVRRTDNLRLLFRFNDTLLSRPVQGIVWSPDGQQLVSISYNKLMFWNSSNGHKIGQPSTGHTRYINSLAISSDGSFITTASSDQTVRLWSTKTHQKMGGALNHTVVATCIAISPNAELLASGGNDGQIRVWGVERALSTAMELDSSCDPYFERWMVGRNLYREALSDAEKVIKHNPSSYVGYEMKHEALHTAQRYDEAIEALNIMLSKLDDSPDPQIQQLHWKYVRQSKANDVIRRAVRTGLESAPLRLLDTSTGYLCDRDAQIRIFMKSMEYKELYVSMMHASLHMESIDEAVAKYFSWAMLSHRWENKEPSLRDIWVVHYSHLD
ncbi:WD40 repeat-like protein [Suillus weaverae]|nr:WD40 repeat-like protein [Suillus weaverae]